MTTTMCELGPAESFSYSTSEPYEPYPIVKVKMFRRELERPLRVEAYVDTGFDGALILSRAVGEIVRERCREADGFEEIDAAGIGIPCDVYELDVSIRDGWFHVRAHLPQAGDLGNILGRILLNRCLLCFRGSDRKLYLANRIP